MEKNNMNKKNINSHSILLLITVGLFILLYAAGYFMYGFGANAKGFEKLQNFLDIFRTNAALICIACDTPNIGMQKPVTHILHFERGSLSFTIGLLRATIFPLMLIRPSVILVSIVM